MGTSFLNQWFSDGAIKAIGWTLIHSLWIGLIISLLAALVIMFTRKSGAALRYQLLCGVLVLFVLSVSVVFYMQIRSNHSGQINPESQKFLMGENHINFKITNQHFATHTSSPVEVLVNFLNCYINIIFIAWLLLFVMNSLKMMSGLLYIQRLRNYKIHEVSEELKHQIELFSRQIGIRQTIRLVQSELVKLPVVVGWLKPLILLPIGIITQLSAEQLDSILWHELAHIGRRDYLVNLLQAVIETVFFFNPGLLWLSSLIRAEREACCDDMVLSHLKHKADYLEALLWFGIGEFKETGLAMGIGSGNQLRDRLKRMISQENKRLSGAEKMVLTAGLILLLMLNIMPKASAIAGRMVLPLKQAASALTSKLKSSKNGDSTIPRHQKQIKTKSQFVTNTIAPSRSDSSITFVSVLFKNGDADPANTDIRAMDDKGNKYHFVTEDNKIVSMEINGTKIDDENLSSYDYMVATIERELAEKRRVRQEDRARFKDMQARTRFETMKTQLIKDSLKAMEPAEPNYVAADGPEPKAMKLMKMRLRIGDDSLRYADEVKRMQEIVADLVKDKVLANSGQIKWFGLSNTEFIVNGQKQSAEMQQRYKTKYGVHEGWGLYYGPVQMTGRGVFINAITGDNGRPPHPIRSKKPEPKSVGFEGRAYGDTIAWKNPELISQQAHFAAVRNEKRADLLQQQQAFATKQTEKRIELMQQQQQALLAGQYEKARQLWLKYDIDLQPAISGVIADLVSANVIGDKSELSSFSLTNQALMVNGKKQAEDIHEKLTSKYLDRSAYPENSNMNWNRIKDDPNFGLHFDTGGGEGLGIIGKISSQ